MDNNAVLVSKLLGSHWIPVVGTQPVFRSNLVNQPIERRDEAPLAEQHQQLERLDGTWFRDLSASDLRLTSAAAPASTQADRTTASAKWWTETLGRRALPGTSAPFNWPRPIGSATA